MTTVKGVIAKVKLNHEGTTGWKYYKMAFEDGEIYTVSIGPKDDPSVMEEGKSIAIQPGKFKTPEGDPQYQLARAPRGQNGTSGGNKSNTSDDYWEHKFVYESKERDPKIEFQRYLKYTFSMYEAALQKMSKGLNNVSDINRLIDAAYAKAEEIHARRTKPAATQRADDPFEGDPVVKEITDDIEWTDL